MQGICSFVNQTNGTYSAKLMGKLFWKTNNTIFRNWNDFNAGNGKIILYLVSNFKLFVFLVNYFVFKFYEIENLPVGEFVIVNITVDIMRY